VLLSFYFGKIFFFKLRHRIVGELLQLAWVAVKVAHKIKNQASAPLYRFFFFVCHRYNFYFSGVSPSGKAPRVPDCFAVASSQ
jgi:hypothetical protein